MAQKIWKKEFDQAVGDLLPTPEVQQLRKFHHHRNINRYDHTIRVAEVSFQVAKRLGLDARATARAALLHDLFYYDKTCRRPDDRGWVILNHPEEALDNARRLTKLSPKEENIILAHMWPVSRHAPHCREAWVVNVVDDLVAVRDYFSGKSTSNV